MRVQKDLRLVDFFAMDVFQNGSPGLLAELVGEIALAEVQGLSYALDGEPFVDMIMYIGAAKADSSGVTLLAPECCNILCELARLLGAEPKSLRDAGA